MSEAETKPFKAWYFHKYGQHAWVSTQKSQDLLLRKLVRDFCRLYGWPEKGAIRQARKEMAQARSFYFAKGKALDEVPWVVRFEYHRRVINRGQ